MRTHALKNAGTIVLHYSVISPPQEQTPEQEGLEAGIEINNITILGREVSKVKFSELLNKNESWFIGEILDGLKMEQK